MPAFYNRHPWNLTIALAVFSAALLSLAAATSWWVLIAPFGIAGAIYCWRRIVRFVALSRDGYFSRRTPQSALLYEELHESKIRSFTLKLENTEPGHFELFVPSDVEWKQEVPDWAIGRRIEIAERIAKHMRREDVHITDTAPGV